MITIGRGIWVLVVRFMCMAVGTYPPDKGCATATAPPRQLHAVIATEVFMIFAKSAVVKPAHWT